jgi:hypothetical protein
MKTTYILVSVVIAPVIIGVAIYFLKNKTTSSEPLWSGYDMKNKTQSKPLPWSAYQAIVSYEFDDAGQGRQGGIKMSIDTRGNAEVEEIPVYDHEGKYTFALTQEEMDTLNKKFFEYQFLSESDTRALGVDDVGQIIIKAKNAQGVVIHEVSQNSYNETGNINAIAKMFNQIFEQKKSQK